MQLKLTERMQTIADFAGSDEVVADIGTDHGYIPIWLLLNGKCKRAIMSDVNRGPLERAAAGTERYLGTDAVPDMRLGSGLEVLDAGEADTVIIAGMGGILIRDILAADTEKTLSLKKLILQPRTNSAALRLWITESLTDFSIVSERVVKEGKKFSEIICAVRNDRVSDAERHLIRTSAEIQNRLGIPDSFSLEIPCMYLADPHKSVSEYLKKRCDVEKNIIESASRSGRTDAAAHQCADAKKRLEIIEKMIGAYNENRKNSGNS